MPQKERWRKVVRILAFGLGVYLALCTYLGYQYVHPVRQTPQKPSFSVDVSIPSPNGLIPAWSSPNLAAKKGSPVVFVLAYGYGGTRESWAPMLRALPKAGYDCVTACMPGQESSPEREVGFGFREAKAILDTVKWVRGQYQKPPKIVLLGVSMGGAASWIASEMDPSIDAVVTEGAYARFDEAMNNWLNRKMPGSPFYLKPMIWIASAMNHVDPAEIVPERSAAKWHKPALVIQGADDTLIPMAHAERLAKAASCPLWIVPGAQHAKCSLVDEKGYLNHLVKLAQALR